MQRVPSIIKFEGHVYRLVRADFDEDVNAISEGLGAAFEAFDEFMKQHQEKGPAAIPLLLPVFDNSYAAAKAALRIFELVTPSQKQKHASSVLYNGTVYTAVQHPYESLKASDASREYEVCTSALGSIIESSGVVCRNAQLLLESVKQLGMQASSSLTSHPDQLAVEDVDALHPRIRVEEFQAPIRSMEKASQELHYTVGAAATAIKVILDQCDAMVDSWEARVEQMNAPNTSRELTSPVLKSDNPAVVFDEVGGL